MALTIIVSLLIFSVLIIAHEFGHFITARKSGVTVEEFAIGMGPVLFRKKGKKTDLTIRVFPIGGFCRMKGEDGENYESDSFNSAKPWKRILILASGSLMNFLVAIILFATIFMMFGTQTTQIGSVTQDSPADLAGIRVGDTILAVNDQPTAEWAEVTDLISASDGQTITVLVDHQDGTSETVSIHPYFDAENERYMIGITTQVKRNIFTSLGQAFAMFWTYIKLILGVFIGLFRGEFGIDAFTGPIGATAVIGEYISLGLVYILSISASIAVSLGLFNLFPIPALDGSRIIFVIIEKIKGSPINKESEGKIHFVGFVLLMVFAVIIAYKDVIGLIR